MGFDSIGSCGTRGVTDGVVLMGPKPPGIVGVAVAGGVDGTLAGAIEVGDGAAESTSATRDSLPLKAGPVNEPYPT